MDPELIKLLGSGGLTAALLGLIWIVGNRMVAAIDRVGVKLDEHTKTDTAAHADNRESIVEIKAMLSERRQTPIEGVPATFQRRAPTQGG